MAARQHERIDRDALARAAHDLAERLLEGALRRRIRKARDRVALLEVGGRLSVGDQNDLLVLPARAGEKRSRRLERMLHVRPVYVLVPGDDLYIVGFSERLIGSASQARASLSLRRGSTRGRASTGSHRRGSPLPTGSR